MYIQSESHILNYPNYFHNKCDVIFKKRVQFVDLFKLNYQTKEERYN